jgi:hypothetical protein
VAKVDAEMLPEMEKWNWWADGHPPYAARMGARREGKQRKVRMHNVVLGPMPPGFVCDHINHDRLDNRRANLRAITQEENTPLKPGHVPLNRGRSSPASSSRAPGVSWDPASRKWRADIRRGGQRRNLGRFDTERAAAEAYREADRRWQESGLLSPSTDTSTGERQKTQRPAQP